MKIHNAHDALFKELLSSKENAIDFLRQFLPQEITNLMDLASVIPLKTSFISDQLREYFSDVIFQCRLRDTERNFMVSILIEHKSTKEKFTSFQLLNYLSQAYLQQLKNGESLQLIIPFIFYHGKEVWQVDHCKDLFEDLPESFKIFIPNFDFLFTDLVRMNDHELENLENEFILATCLAQKYSHDPEALVDNLIRIFNTFSTLKNRNYIKTLFVYIVSLVKVESKDIKLLTSQIKQPLKDIIMSTYDLLIEEGIEKGIEKNNIETVKRCHSNEFSLADIMLITGLSEKEVKNILKKISEK